MCLQLNSIVASQERYSCVVYLTYSIGLEKYTATTEWLQECKIKHQSDV